MRKAVASKPVTDFSRPDTVLLVSIDPETGFLATPDCPKKKDEFYIAGSQPVEYCPKHGGAGVTLPPPSVVPLSIPKD